MHKLTAADFADTGQWKLIITIKKDGLEAFLLNTVYPELEPQKLCKVTWSETTEEKLVHNIEEAVYNNPRLLDDFSTKIVMFDNKTLFVPAELCDEAPGFEEEYFSKIFNCNAADVISDSDNDIVAAWNFAAGVKGFLFRTFPGAKITNNLLDLVRSIRKKNLPLSVSVFRRGSETDFILMRNQELISAATHFCHDKKEIDYRIMALLRAYRLNPEETAVFYH